LEFSQVGKTGLQSLQVIKPELPEKYVSYQQFLFISKFRKNQSGPHIILQMMHKTSVETNIQNLNLLKNAGKKGFELGA
jgi:hypothetical protein